MKKLEQFRTKPVRMTATSIILRIETQKYLRNLRNGLVFFSTIAFGPYFVSLVAASAPVKALKQAFAEADRPVHERHHELAQRCADFLERSAEALNYVAEYGRKWTTDPVNR